MNRLLALMQREYWENKGAFRTTPIVIGLIHIGLLPEFIEDARRDGMPDDALEPLFRSAEAYIRMWEKAESRAATLKQ